MTNIRRFPSTQGKVVRVKGIVERKPKIYLVGRMRAVAPDGERIAFVAWSNEHTIWQLRPSGGKAVRVDTENPDHHSPSWSPDGNWIAYARALPKAAFTRPAVKGTDRSLTPVASKIALARAAATGAHAALPAPYGG